MVQKNSPADKARASVRAAIECKNTKVDPSCTECTDIPAIRAIILYPNLGTPLIVPPGETKLNFFIVAEGKAKALFGVRNAGGNTFPAPAVLGYMYVDKHLRVYPLSAKKPKEDTREGRLWNDGRICGTAFEHVKVWCLGALDTGTIKDVNGNVFANIRPRTIEQYGGIVPAHPDPKDPLSGNEPMHWVFQVQIDLGKLPGNPAPGELASLAWMVAVPEGYKQQKPLAGLSDWEYQDKLIYDFLEGEKKNPKKSHVPDLYEFDLRAVRANKLPPLKKETSHRLMAWHPFGVGANDVLKVGHISDVHISSRQFALANSDACVLEGISSKLGPKVDNCFIALKELFENMKKAGADVIFLTGDLLDFNRNLDPRKVQGSSPKDQWKYYDLVKNINKAGIYPRGIDDMLIYSLLRYSYEMLKLPVFVTTGNHEAYDLPYGLSPRLNGNAAKLGIEQAMADQSVAIPARFRAAAPALKRVADAEATADSVEAHSNAIARIPYVGKKWTEGTHSNAELVKQAMDRLRAYYHPNHPGFMRMNEGIPADHNLTIYEACLIYGPTFPQILKPFNFTPDHFDWFFTLFTPLADFRIDYKSQILLGLDWGDSEIMVNGDMSYAESKMSVKRADTLSDVGGELMGALMGLPRANKSINEAQRVLIDEVRKSGKKVLMFSHFTIINYDMSIPLGKPSRSFAASDSVFNDYTKGTFSKGRDWLYPRLNHGIHFTLAGHSHRSGVYRLNNTDSSAMTAIGYQPALYNNPNANATEMHSKLFNRDETSRVVVSSCGGPIGAQNLRGELYGCNMMPPSGTLVDITASGSLQLQRVVTDKYIGAKPRFCVALDYVQTEKDQQVIAWIPDGASGRYHVVVGNILECQPCIDKITFHVWDVSGRCFRTFVTGLSASQAGQGLYDMAIADWRNFYTQTSAKKDAKIPPVFAQIDFNQALAAHPLYAQYNFDDPWIFRAEIELVPSFPIIRPAGDKKTEIPDWEWLSTVAPERYLAP